MPGAHKQRKENGLLRASQWIILCLMAQATTVFGLNFNVSLVSLTNHNTSAYPNYTENTYAANFGTTSWINQNGQTMVIDPTQMDESLNPITPGHVSHTDVHTLIPSRPDLRWFAHTTCWFGSSGHIDIGLTNNTTAYVAAMISDMESRGFNGLVMAWYGIGAPDGTDAVAQKVKAYLASSANTNKNFHYMISLESGLAGGTSNTNIETNIVYCQNQYFSDTNYEHDPVTNGHPILLFFSVRSTIGEANMEAVKAATDPDTLWVEQGINYISEPWENMTFQWTDNFDTGVNASDPFNLSEVTSDFATIKGKPAKQAFGAVCGRFNGTLTKSVGWSEGKYLPCSNGLCEVERASEINAAIPTNMTRMQVPTWCDWEEGTQVESGIENSFAVSGQMSASNVLSWTIASGDERTVDHYEIYASTNGVNAAILGSVPTGVYQTNLIAAGLSSGVYQLYVDAIGKPCIRNHMSAAVSAVITVSNSPTVLTDIQPLSQIVWPGSPVSFAVVAAGVQPLTYQWTLDSQNIPGATNSAYSFAALAGTNYYHVTISNSYGSANSSSGAVAGMGTTSYGYRVRISFPGYGGSQTLTNFPALVQFSNGMAGFSYAQFASSTGGDLRFTDATGSIPLPYEINQWNISGLSSVWVQVPALSNTNTYIWAYWGNPAATSPPAYTTNGTVWQPQYMLVWHLEQSGFPYNDSAALYPALTGVAPAVTTGEIGSGGLFNGSSSYLHAGTVNAGTAFTLFAWVKMSSSANSVQGIWANNPGGWNANGFALFVNTYETSNQCLLLQDGDGVNGDSITSAAGVVTPGVWHAIAASINETAGTAQLYVDGNNVASGSVVTDFGNNSGLDFGRYTNGDFCFTGSMDEARIAPGVCSSNWIQATWMNAASNSVFNGASAVNPTPTITCTNSAAGLLLAWPESSGVFVVYTTTNLTPPAVWLPVTNVVVNVNGQWQALISPPANGSQFYRLQIH